MGGREFPVLFILTLESTHFMLSLCFSVSWIVMSAAPGQRCSNAHTQGNSAEAYLDAPKPICHTLSFFHSSFLSPTILELKVTQLK